MALSDKAYLQINQALFSLTHAYESRMTREEANHLLGLRLSDCSVLMVMGLFAPLNASRLSELMDLDLSTISGYVQRLVEMGLVQRERNPEDRRTWWLTLTEAGQEAAQSIIAEAVTYTRDFLAALDDEEQRMLHRLLLKAAHSLGFEWQ